MAILQMLFSGGALGSLFGFLGSWLTNWQKGKEQERQFAHDLDMRRLDMEARKQDAELAMKTMELKTEGELKVAEMDLVKESYKEAFTPLISADMLAGASTWIKSFALVLLSVAEFARTIMRPALTGYLVLASTFITMWIYRTDPSTFIGSDMAKDTIGTITFLTVSAVTWWFADRQRMKSSGKGNR